MPALSNQLPHPAELAPHDPPMLLIDEVVEVDDDHVVTRTRLSPDNLFNVPGRGVPAYVGFELMAQSISIFDGAARHRNGDKPAVGFLLGCRRYSTDVDWLQTGDHLEIQAMNLLSEGELRSFDCHIRQVGGENLAQGVINVFRPENLDAFLASTRA